MSIRRIKTCITLHLPFQYIKSYPVAKSVKRNVALSILVALGKSNRACLFGCNPQQSLFGACLLVLRDEPFPMLVEEI